MSRFKSPDEGPQNLFPTLKHNGQAIGEFQNIVLIEKRPFLRECFARALRYNSKDVMSFSSISEWQAASPDVRGSLLVLSIVTLSVEEIHKELLSLSSISSCLPTILLAMNEDPGGALDALHHGAKAYVSSNVSLDFVIETMRFVCAGGSYIPPGCLAGAPLLPIPGPANGASNPFTSRELAVIQLIRRGNSNKMIAYALNMCESTVKVHVRHIMKKTQTRNRTELAMMSKTLVNGVE
jgi:DNA-binding NarL/FixJ family response regulator